MLVDVVVDTNVFVHADTANARRTDSQAFLAALLSCATLLCVDEGFSLEESKNRSLIGSEYLEHIRAPMFGFHVLASLAANKRVQIVTRTVTAATLKICNQSIAKKRDRTFVRVALNSTEVVLVSHDFADFSKAKRKALGGALGISIIDAAQGSAHL